jgi:hypothetical protein
MKLLLLNNAGSGAAPGGSGSNTQVIFNDNGSLAGDSALTWNKTSDILTVTGDVNLSDGGTYTTTLQTITPTAARTISLPDATGTVALVAGSSGQLLYNNAGANAGVPSSVVGATGDITLALNGAASTPPLDVTGTWFTGGTGTTTKPQVLIEPTGTTSTAWSTSGTGLGVNATSAFAGNLLDLQLNGSTRFFVTKDGDTKAARYSGLTAGYLAVSSTSCIVASASDASGTLQIGNTSSVFVTNDASNILAQRNGTAAQTSRVYNTYTSGTSYELGKLEWASNVFRIGTEKGSGGGTARAVEVHTDSISRLALDTTGSVRVVTGLTVATLPGTPAVGMIARVTDALAPAMGGIVASGGAAAALVWYNGTNWRVIGV